MLGLEEITGQRGTADAVLEPKNKALKKMEQDSWNSIIALVTDDLTTMISFHGKLKELYPWIIVHFPPFNFIYNF